MGREVTSPKQSESYKKEQDKHLAPDLRCFGIFQYTLHVTGGEGDVRDFKDVIRGNGQGKETGIRGKGRVLYHLRKTWLDSTFFLTLISKICRNSDTQGAAWTRLHPALGSRIFSIEIPL